MNDYSNYYNGNQFYDYFNYTFKDDTYLSRSTFSFEESKENFEDILYLNRDNPVLFLSRRNDSVLRVYLKEENKLIHSDIIKYDYDYNFYAELEDLLILPDETIDFIDE